MYVYDGKSGLSNNFHVKELSAKWLEDKKVDNIATALNIQLAL